MQTTEPQTTKRIQCYAIAKELGLTREERHELAEMVFKKDITSWKQLSDSQMERLAEGLFIVECVGELYRQRPPQP